MTLTNTSPEIVQRLKTILNKVIKKLNFELKIYPDEIITKDSVSWPMLAINPTIKRSVYSGSSNRVQNSGKVCAAYNHRIFE